MSTLRVAMAVLFLWGTSEASEAPLLPPEADGRPACKHESDGSDRRLAFGLRGRIQALTVKVGDRVKLGTRIARLDCSGAEADLQIATAELDVIRAEYSLKMRGARDEELRVAEARQRAAQVALQDAETTHRRLKQLAGNGGVVLQPELSDAARRLASAELDAAIAQSSVDLIRNPLSEAEHEYWRAREKAAERAVRRAQVQVGYCDLRVPMAGVVHAVLNFEGEFVDGMQPVVVLRVGDATDTP